jgi:hypothetical protein
MVNNCGKGKRTSRSVQIYSGSVSDNNFCRGSVPNILGEGGAIPFFDLEELEFEAPP